MSDQPTPIAIAVVEHNGCFLIGQRQPGTALAGYWEFPGGSIEPGESPEEAAIRECREEAGIDVEICGRYPSHVVRYNHGAVHLHFFACNCLTPQPTPSAGFRWIPRDELSRYEFPRGNRKLLEILLGDSA